MAYGYLGTMKTKPGQRDAVLAVLLEGIETLREHGCLAYVVCEGDEDEIVIFEAWTSKQHHDDSLKLPDVREAINRAMPLLTGEFTSREVNVIGGIGI